MNLHSSGKCNLSDKILVGGTKREQNIQITLVIVYGASLFSQTSGKMTFHHLM